MNRVFGLAAVALLCTSVQAEEIDISLNDDAVRIIYVRDYEARDLQADLGFVTNSDKGTVVNASLYTQGLASDGVNPIRAGIGVRTGYVDGDRSGQNGFPVALGGFITYTFPQNNRLSIRADGWLAPDIVTLGDLENYEDFSIRLQYNVLRQANVYIGARHVKAEFDNNSYAVIDSGAHVGLNFRF